MIFTSIFGDVKDEIMIKSNDLLSPTNNSCAEPWENEKFIDL